MNLHISLESQFRAAHKARQARFAAAATPKQDKPQKHTFRFLSEADAHVRAWRWWRAITGAEMRPAGFMAIMCEMMCVSVAEVKGTSRRRRVALARKSLCRSLHWRYTTMPNSQIARMMDLDQTTVSHHLMRTTKERLRCGLAPAPKWNKLTDEQKDEVRKLRASGVLIKDVAARFGVSPATITRTVYGYGYHRKGKA